MRLPGVLMWVAAALLSNVCTATTRESLHSRSNNQLRGRRNLTASKNTSTRSGALIEGSDETIESYSKNQPGRHVCTQEQAVTEPVRTRESYCRPVYKTYTLPCEQGKMCRRYRVVYETAYRDVLKMTVSHKTSFSCCPGWTQGTKANHGCNKAVCTRPCQNGGACLKPEFCGCRPGYTGKHCEQDLDECASQRHTCDHACVNTLGSYKCRCQEGFTLQPDGRSCLSTHTTTSQPPVVRGDREDREELEDDDERDFSVEYVNLTRRVSKLEKLMSKPTEKISSVSLNDVTAKLDMVIESLSVLKSRVDRMERRLEHHHKGPSRKRLDMNAAEDSRMQTFVRQLALLEDRLDGCACSADSRNKIDK